MKKTFLIALTALLPWTVVSADIFIEATPTENRPSVLIKTTREEKGVHLPLPRQNVAITGKNGLYRQVQLDHKGEFEFNLDKLVLNSKEQQLKLLANVTWRNQKKNAEFVVDKNEILKKTADFYRVQAQIYLKKKNKLMAMRTYTDYLMEFGQDGSARLAFKQLAISLSKKMSPNPQIPRSAFNLLKKGLEEVKNKNLFKAIEQYEAAQSVAPWWPEPYYSQGVVFENLAYQKGLSYAEAAYHAYELFLQSAAVTDDRTEDVTKRVANLKKIQDGLGQSRVVKKR